VFNLNATHIVGVLQLAEKSPVLVMAADPEPSDGVFIKDSNCAIAQGHPDRPNVLGIIDAFEA
jgi:hypothetical protein